MDADGWAAIAAWAAWAGFAATAGAGIYTALQARTARAALREAKHAREAAQDQAQSARESAESASKSAYATVDQARSARESVELARTQLYRAERPRLELASGDRRDGKLMVLVRMTSGPPEITVSGRWTVSPSGPSEQIEGAEQQIDNLVGSTTTYRLVLDDRVEVPVSLPKWATAATVRLDLVCRGTGEDDREWETPRVMDWAAPVKPRIW